MSRNVLDFPETSKLDYAAMAYNYLQEDTFDGSLLPLPTLHKAVWAYIVSKAKPMSSAPGGGAVRLVPMLMAVYFPDASTDQITSVIDCFCSPDEKSRTEAHEGRRLLPMGRDLYAIPTYETHAGSRLARDAERKRRYREEQTADRNGNVPLIMNTLEYQRLLEVHAFVGTRLRVPKVLHSELRTKVGADGETKLQQWYLLLDQDAEQSGEPIPNIFDWLRPRFIQWCEASGLVKPVSKFKTPDQIKAEVRALHEANAKKKAAKKLPKKKSSTR